MESPAAKRPTSVTVIGWIYIAVSAFMFLSGLLAFTAFVFINKATGGQFPPPMDADMPAAVRTMPVIFRYFGVLSLLQI